MMMLNWSEKLDGAHIQIEEKRYSKMWFLTLSNCLCVEELCCLLWTIGLLPFILILNPSKSPQSKFLFYIIYFPLFFRIILLFLSLCFIQLYSGAKISPNLFRKFFSHVETSSKTNKIYRHSTFANSFIFTKYLF